MKRSPMPQRTTPLAAGTPLRRTKLRQVSKARKAENRIRRAVVIELFPERPQCAAPGCPRPADDVHEPLMRSRGGSITDPANMTPLCRPCHTEITDTQPAWAYEAGLLRHSWDGGAA